MSENKWTCVSALDDEARRYAVELALPDTADRKYIYRKEDEQLLGYNTDKVGQVSDSFILYAIAYFGVASVSEIALFLRMKKRTAPGTLISTEESEKFLREQLQVRLRVLCDRGYVMSFKYYLKRDTNNIVQCYVISGSGFDIMRTHLKKTRFSLNKAFALSVDEDLIEWAAAAHVGAKLLSSRKIVNELDRYTFSKSIGSVFFPFEFLSKGDDGSLFYVAGMNGNWRKEEGIQSDYDYAQWLSHQLAVIRNYLTRRTAKGTAVIILVVENVEALKVATQAIAEDGETLALIDRILFTGEGAIDRVEDGDFGKGLFRMKLEGKQIVVTPLSGGAAFV